MVGRRRSPIAGDVNSTLDGAQGRDRTTDTVIFSHVLYQLSYLGAENPPGGGRESGGRYRGSERHCPERRPGAHCDESPAIARSIAPVVRRAIAAHPILVFLLLARHRVDAGQPAIEVDVGAALGTERPELIRDRLGADRAARGAARGGLVGHRTDMGI